MSDRMNPENANLLPNEDDVFVDGLFFSADNNINLGNPQDVFSFTIPAAGVTVNNGAIEYDLNGEFVILDQEINVSLGVDSNGNGSFDPDEIIGQTITVDPSDPFFSLTDLDPNLSINDFLLQENQDYFLAIEDAGFDTFYDVNIDLTPFLVGELTTNDTLYQFRGDTYYFDQLNEFTVQAGVDEVTVGEPFELSLISDSFDPVLFLLNQDTNEVIDVAFESTSIGTTVDGADLQAVQLSFEVQADITYVASVESALPGQTGDYFLNID